jgi:GR25 family glycosyltransferase involved in LPS biosynthesis
MLLFSFLMSGLIFFGLIRGYYALELWLNDPFLEAMLITPLVYWRVRYFEAKPSGRPRRFDMRQNATFVINLDSDAGRFQSFQKVNNADNGEFYQRFSAFRWIPASTKPSSLRGKQNELVVLSDAERETLSMQEQAMNRYPFLKYSVQNGLPGSAGCTMSHIQVLEQLVDDNMNEYYFIFEDDARLSAQLLQQRYLEGPPDADIIILSPTNTKTVRVPYDHGPEGFAVRVVQSYGAFAYVVTQRGATKLLQHFHGNHYDPIDVAFHRAKGVKMYQPTNGWPQAYHSAVRSTRHAANKKRGDME